MLKKFYVNKEFDILNKDNQKFITVLNDVQPFVFQDLNYNQIVFYSKEQDEQLEVDHYQIDQNFVLSDFFRQQFLLFKHKHEKIYKVFDMEKKIWLEQFYFEHDIEQLYTENDIYIIFASGGRIYQVHKKQTQFLIDIGPTDIRQQVFKVQRDRYIILQDGKIIDLILQADNIQNVIKEVNMKYQALNGLLFFDNRLIMLVNNNNQQEIITYQIDSQKIENLQLAQDNFQMLENTVFFCNDKEYKECLVLTRSDDHQANQQQNQDIIESRLIYDSGIQFQVLDIRSLEVKSIFNQNIENFNYKNLFLEQIFIDDLENLHLQGHYLIFENENEIQTRQQQERISQLFGTKEGIDFINFRSMENKTVAYQFLKSFFFKDEIPNLINNYKNIQNLQEFNEKFLGECYQQMIRDGHIQYIQTIFKQKDKNTKENVFQEYTSFIKFVVQPLLINNSKLIQRDIAQKENVQIVENLRQILDFIQFQVKNASLNDMQQSKITSVIILDTQVSLEIQNLNMQTNLLLRQLKIIQFYRELNEDYIQKLDQEWLYLSKDNQSILFGILQYIQQQEGLSSANFIEFIYKIQNIDYLNSIFLYLFLDCQENDRKGQISLLEIKAYDFNKQIFSEFHFDLETENNALSWLIFDYLIQNQDDFSQFNEQNQFDAKIQALISLSPEISPFDVLSKIRIIQFQNIYIAKKKLFSEKINEDYEQKIAYLCFCLKNKMYQESYSYYKNKNIKIEDFCEMIKIEQRFEIVNKVTFDSREIKILHQVLYKLDSLSQYFLDLIKSEKYREALKMYNNKKTELQESKKISIIANTVRSLNLNQFNCH